MDFLVNTIIDYFASNNEMALAIVVKPGVERLQVQSVAKTEKITPRQILTSHGIADGANLSKLAEIQNAINAAMKEVETEFLWENLLEKGGQFSVEDVCQEYFGDKQPINMSALARVMLEDNVHFKRVQNQFTVNSREEAEKIETLKRQRAEKAALRERTMKWLSDTLATKPETPQPVPEEQEPFIANTIDFLLRGANNEAVNLLSAASGKLNVREVAIRILPMPTPSSDRLIRSSFRSSHLH